MSKKWIFTFKKKKNVNWPWKAHSALYSRAKIDCDKKWKVFLIRTFFYQRPLLRWAIWGERRLEFQPQLFQQKLPLNIFSRLLKHLCESFPRLWTSPSKLLRYILDIHVPYHLTPLCIYFHVQAAQEKYVTMILDYNTDPLGPHSLCCPIKYHPRANILGLKSGPDQPLTKWEISILYPHLRSLSWLSIIVKRNDWEQSCSSVLSYLWNM